MVLSVGAAPRELRAAVLAAKAATREIQNDINKSVRTFKPVWENQLDSHTGRDPRDALLVAGARIQAGNPPALVTASTGKKVGRLIARENWPGFEYGANQAAVSIYDRRSQNGGSHHVRRRVQTGHPSRRRNGRVIGPAVQDILPRIASYWVQTIVKKYLDALEGKS